MICPYCGGEMERGLIQSPQELSWHRGDERKFLTRARFHEGSVVLSRFSLAEGSAVTAYLCRGCRKVIVDYASEDADLNS